ncbi:MAG: hypothetical protein HYU33_00960 [Candidatus Omnitrophica bacterium]|nr:hypothetical protein [Candidatus Omnitrophota bacterium]
MKEMLPLEELKSVIQELLPGVPLDLEAGSLLVSSKDLITVCRCLKNTERFSLDYLANFKGHPMRKDYIVEDQDAVETLSP